MSDDFGLDVISSASGSLLGLAKRYCLVDLPSEADYQIPIIFSALGIEAYMNDLEEFAAQYLAKDDPKNLLVLKDTLRELEASKAQIKLKVSLTYFIISGNSIDKGSQPYQDFSMLIDIRNSLVHSKPIKYNTSNNEPHKYVRYLLSRNVITTDSPHSLPDWYVHIIKKPVALWAYNTAVKTIHYLYNAMPASQLKFMVSALTTSLEEIQQ